MSSVFNAALLAVPANSVDDYKADPYWQQFIIITDIMSSIPGVDVNNLQQQPIYDMQGRRLTETPRSGMYIRGGKIIIAK